MRLTFSLQKSSESLMLEGGARKFMCESFHRRVVAAIRAIPAGKVATYGQIAFHAGNPRASRQVAYILHSSSQREDLPWHRVVNSRGMISLKGHGRELQRRMLEGEGVVFDEQGSIDLKRFLWQP